jgi:hypothetical protein
MKIRARVLGSVNKRLEEMRKEDAERMTPALTILTVGVAGPIASVLVKGKAAKVFEKLAENLQGKASKTALEAAGEMVKDSAGDLPKKGLGFRRRMSVLRWKTHSNPPERLPISMAISYRRRSTCRPGYS